MVNDLATIFAAAALVFCGSCATSTLPVEVMVATPVDSNISSSETGAVVAATQKWLTEELQRDPQRRGGLRKATLTAVRADGRVAVIEGCGTFYDYTIPQRYLIVLVALHDTDGWKLNSWEVVLESLHGPPLPCR